MAKRRMRWIGVGLAVAAGLLALLWQLPTRTGPAPIRNLVLISLDTTRADAIDTGSGARAVTPALRQLAQSAWVFGRAFTAVNQTLPSHLAALTGRMPHELGVFGNDWVYPGREPMIQEVLQASGWRTQAVVSMGALASSTGISRGFDLFLEGLHPPTQFFTPAAEVTDRALAILSRAAPEHNFLFLHYSDPHTPYAPPAVEAPFVVRLDGQPVATFNAYQGAILRLSLSLAAGRHTVTFQAEVPPDTFDAFTLRRLRPPPDCSVTPNNLDATAVFADGAFQMPGSQGSLDLDCPTAGHLGLFQVIPQARLSAAVRLYRQEVEYMDGELGRFLNGLDASAWAASTAVIVFADHGENLGEDGYAGHVRYLHRPIVQVPLIVRIPGRHPARWDTPVSTASIAPTLAELAGIRWPGAARERSLLAAASPLPASGQWDRPVLSFAFAPGAAVDLVSTIYWPYQSIAGVDGSAETVAYYDLRLAAERRLDAIDPSVIRRQAGAIWTKLEESRREWSSALRGRQAGDRTLSDEALERLRALGYL